jgi:hypothetical protein
MNGFFQKLERFFVNVIIIGLVVLISFQILMKNDTTYRNIKDWEFALRNFLGFKQKTEQVTGLEEERSGMITIDLLQDLSLPQVYLIINGQRVADFSEGVVKLKVDEGDLLKIDARFYDRSLWFEITSLSLNIRNWQVGQQFRIKGEEFRLGVVQFYDQL